MRLQYVLSLLLVALPLTTAACSGATAGETVSGDEDDSEEALSKTSVTPGTWSLFDEPNAKPNPACDVHTILELAQSGGAKATLSETVSGACKMMVQPNLRTYRLRQSATSCGSKIYSAKRTTKDGTYHLKITDHRTRLCEDVVAAQIIVEETSPGFPGPITSTKYSLDKKPDATVTVEGTLMRVMAIGGETTGRVIMSSAGSSELVLDADESAQFVSGRKAKVTGRAYTKAGVEIRERHLIDVSKLAVCPEPGTHIDCMPPVRPGGACSDPWFTTCPGVNFTY